MNKYDLIIIGGGPGGYVAAIKASQNDLKVLLIEKDVVGGICLNHGCIPTKALLKSAKTYQEILTSKDYGVTVDKESITLNLSDIVKRKNTIVRRLTGGVKHLLKKNNVDVINDYATLINEHEVKVADKTFYGKNIILATGGSAFVPNIEGLKKGLESGFVVTSKELLNPKFIPKHLTIIGGGVIGIEFANMFKGFGSEITVIEMADNILNQMDEDIITEYNKILKNKDINVLTSSEVKKINTSTVTYVKDGNEHKLNTDLVLLSVGIKPHIEAFKAVNITLDGWGVKTNEFMQTNIPHIYAIGDLTGKHMLAHVASFEGIVAVNHILGINEAINYNQIPAAVYSFTEIAAIGFTEKEAKKRNLNYEVSVFPIMANGKALADGKKDGFIKIIREKDIDEILGAHILAYNAVDLINEISVAMKLEGTSSILANTIHAHPSLSEIIMEAAMKKPIHL